MKLQVSFKIVNSEYDQSYADEYNWGEEGPGNMKYLRAEKFEINQVVSFELNKNTQTVITCTAEDDTTESFEVENVSILEAKLQNGEVEQFIVSNELIKDSHGTDSRSKNYRFYFYFLDKVEGEYGILDLTSYIRIDKLPKRFNEVKWKHCKMEHKRKSERIEVSGVMPVKGR